MTRTIPQDIPAHERLTARPIVLALGIAGGLLAAGTAVLWIHYGSAVFFETIQAGLNACF